MSTQTVQQRRALRYAAIKHLGDLEVAIQRDLTADVLSRQRRVDHHMRVARDRLAAERLRHAASSTPTLQRLGESPAGIFLMLMIGLAIFALAACGNFRPSTTHPASTMTLPNTHANCSHGFKTRQTGSIGAYGTPVVEVTDEPCEGRRR
jgi:hypothetical protein